MSLNKSHCVQLFLCSFNITGTELQTIKYSCNYLESLFYDFLAK